MSKNKMLDILDSVAIIGLTIILIMAFAYQLLDNELPCALCVMQRMGLYAISIGLVINLILGRKQTNYLMVVIGAVINSWISLLQVILHIVPNSGGFGSSIFGLHMYTWNFIVSMVFIIYGCLAGFLHGSENQIRVKIAVIHKVIISVLFFTLLANALSAFIECGPHLCPSDPQSYWLLDMFSGKFGAREWNSIGQNEMQK